MQGAGQARAPEHVHEKRTVSCSPTRRLVVRGSHGKLLLIDMGALAQAYALALVFLLFHRSKHLWWQLCIEGPPGHLSESHRSFFFFSPNLRAVAVFARQGPTLLADAERFVPVAMPQGTGRQLRLCPRRGSRMSEFARVFGFFHVPEPISESPECV